MFSMPFIKNRKLSLISIKSLPTLKESLIFVVNVESVTFIISEENGFYWHYATKCANMFHYSR